MWNNVIPDELGFRNHRFTRSEIEELVAECFDKLGKDKTTVVLDDIKDIGFKFATVSGTTIAIKDIITPPQKQSLLSSADQKIRKLNDSEAIIYITQLKGLGVWSAELFLMFNLNRPNIFPIKDIGLLRAISKNYKTSYPPSQKFLNKISKLHEGNRTMFTWYMWRSIDPTDVEY